MSTRSAVFRRNSDGSVKGVYHHFDGYPSGVGSELIELYEYFGGDAVKMMQFIVDDLKCDGYKQLGNKPYQSFDEADNIMIEYIYVIDPTEQSIVMYGAFEQLGIKFKMYEPVEYAKFFNRLYSESDEDECNDELCVWNEKDGKYVVTLKVAQNANKFIQDNPGVELITLNMMKNDSAWTNPDVARHLTNVPDKGEFTEMDM